MAQWFSLTRCSRLAVLAVSLLFMVGLRWHASPAPQASAVEKPAAKRPSAESECRWTAGPIQLDGRLDEDAWGKAQRIDSFVVGWQGQRPARTSTAARLLWDDKYLYFAAEMEDADLYADVKEADGDTWHNDVFELFFKPSDEQRGYYEFEISPANTPLDMFLPSRGSGGYHRWAKAAVFHMETAVALRGTLNEWRDTDQGWTVEGRLPWTDFTPTGGKPQAGEAWRFALCRYDYSVEFEAPELSSTAPLKRPDFHHYEDYTLLRFVRPEAR